jgi:hypothetical protein
MSDQFVLIYPNPADDFICIQSEKNLDKLNFELFDMQGQQILSKEMSSGKTISLKELSPGLYLYYISIDGELQSGKLIKK